MGTVNGRVVVATIIAVLGLSAPPAFAHAKAAHHYTATLQSTPVATAGGYPAKGGTAILAGVLSSSVFGPGALVDRITVIGEPSPDVVAFAGGEDDYLGLGELQSLIVGTDTLQPDGSQKIVAQGRCTRGLGAFRAGKCRFAFSGTIPPGSTVLSGHSSGSVTY